MWAPPSDGLRRLLKFFVKGRRVGLLRWLAEKIVWSGFGISQIRTGMGEKLIVIVGSSKANPQMTIRSGYFDRPQESDTARLGREPLVPSRREPPLPASTAAGRTRLPYGK
jgi:hypothetical protein